MSRFLKVVCTGLALAAVVSTASAATFTWNSQTSGNWDNTGATGWNTGGTYPNANGDAVIGDRELTASVTLTVNVADAKAGSILFKDTTPGNTWALASSGVGLLTLNNSGNNVTVDWENYNAGFSWTAATRLEDNVVFFSKGNGTGTVGAGTFVPNVTLVATVNSNNANATANFKTISLTGSASMTLTALGNGANVIQDLQGFVNNSTSLQVATISGSNTLTNGDFSLTTRLGVSGASAQIATLVSGTTLNVSGNRVLVDTRGSHGTQISSGITATDLVVTGAGNQSLYFVGGGNSAPQGNNNGTRSTLTLANVNTFSGSTSVTAGRLALDFTGNNTANSRINSSGTLTLTSGTLTMLGNATANSSQAVASTTLSGGLNSIDVRRASATVDAALSLGAITNNPGSMFLFFPAATAGTVLPTVSTSSTGTNGILGGWAYMTGSGNSTTPVNQSSGGAQNFIGISGGNMVVPTYTNLVTSGGSATTNYQFFNAAATLTLTGSVVGNALKMYDNGNGQQLPITLAMGANNITLTTGGFLYHSQFPQSSITGTGTLSGASANDPLYMYINTRRLTVGANLIGTGTGALVVGGQGELKATAAANYTGGTYINGAVFRADGSALSSGNLRLQSAGSYATNGSFTRALGTGAGQVQFGPGGGGFSAEGGPLTVNLGGAGVSVNASDLNRNLVLNNQVFSTHPVYFVNPVVMDSEAGLTITVSGLGYSNGTGGFWKYGNYAGYGTAPAIMLGGLSGNGNLLVYGNGSEHSGNNSGIGMAEGMVYVKGGLSYNGNTVLNGGSLYVDNQNDVPGNLKFLAGGVLATHGTFNKMIGGDSGQVMWATSYATGGFAAVGGNLTVSLTGGGTNPITPGSGPNFGGLVLGNWFSTHPVDFQNNITGSVGILTAGPVVNQISGKLSGASNVTFYGAGMISLTNTGNDFTGSVTVFERTVLYQVANSSAFGTGAGGIGILSGTIDLNGNSITNVAWNNGNVTNGYLTQAAIINSNTATPVTFGSPTKGIIYASSGTQATAWFGGAGNLTFAGPVSSTAAASGGLSWKGTGNFTFTGNVGTIAPTGNASAYTALWGGNTILDYSSDTGNKLMYGSAGSGVPAVYLVQTNLELKGHASTPITQNTPGATATQGLSLETGGGVTIAPGASGYSTLKLTTAGADLTFNLNYITSGVSAVDFSKNETLGGTATFTTDTRNNNRGIFGGWATWNKTDWAYNTVNAADSAIAALPAGSYSNNTAVNTWVANSNITNSGNGTYTGATNTLTISTLKFDFAGASTVTINAANTLTIGDTAAAPAGSTSPQSGGILLTSAVGANDSTITGGQLSNAGANQYLYVHQHNTAGNLTIASTILAGGGNNGVVKIGDGKLILTGTNSYGGPTRVGGGMLEINSIANSGTNQPLGAHRDVYVQNGATLRYTGAALSSNKVFQMGFLGGTITNDGSGTLTLNGQTMGFIQQNYTAAIMRVNDLNIPNLTLNGSGNVVVNGGIFLMSPTADMLYSDSNTVTMDGVTQLTKDGTGTVRLNATNYWNGGTIVNNGTLELGHATDTLPDFCSLTVNTNGALDLLNNVDTTGFVHLKGGTINATGATTGGTLTGRWYNLESGTINANLAGDFAGANKTTTGNVTLTGNNTFSGLFAVNAGKALINNSAGSGTGLGNVTVDAGATIGGSGFIDPAAGMTVSINGFLAPGNSIGTLTVGSSGSTNDATLNGTFLAEVNVSGLADQLAVFGNLILNGSTSVLSIVDTGQLSVGQTYTIASYSGTLTGTFSSDNLPVGWTVNYGAGTSSTITLVPEPGTLALLAFGSLLVMHRRKKKA